MTTYRPIPKVSKAQAEKPQRIDARHVISALAERHKEDVFVEECKNGPSQSGSHSRLDAWAMKKSWSSPMVVGYEVKVSRSDFLQDEKWRAYLPMCNCLYFAAPKGLIKESELSAECGLLELVGDRRLVTRKRAPYRSLIIPESVYRYILMCRVTVQDPGYYNGNVKRETLKRWLEQKEEDRKLGYNVGRAVQQHVAKFECENHRLKRLMEGYDDVRRVMTELGMNPEYGADGWTVRKKVEQAKAIVPKEFESQLESVRNAASGQDRGRLEGIG